MKRHFYKTNKEKIKHFFGGLLGWMILGSILILAFYNIYFALELHKNFVIESINTRWIFNIVFFTWLTYSAFTNYWVAIGLVTNVVLNFLLFGHFIASLEYIAIWVLPPPLVLYAFTQ